MNDKSDPHTQAAPETAAKPSDASVTVTDDEPRPFVVVRAHESTSTIGDCTVCGAHFNVIAWAYRHARTHGHIVRVGRMTGFDYVPRWHVR